MASKVFGRNQKLPYVVSMMSKTTRFISECPQFVTNIQGRFLCSKSNTISIFDSLKVRSISVFCPSRCKVTTKFNNNIHFSRKLDFTSLIGSSIRSLSHIPPKDTLRGNENKTSLETSAADGFTHNDEECNETVEEHEQTIYKGILSAQIKLVKTFSLLTSGIGLSCQPILFYQLQSAGGTGNLGLALASGAFLSFFTFATPLLIHWVSKKYVTELVYNKIEDSYTAITYSLLLRKKKVNFKLSDVKIPDIPGMFTTIIVEREKQIPLFVDGAHAFSDPQHYIKLMGYDKPLNLRWNKEEDASQGVVDARRRKTERNRTTRRSASNHQK